MSPSAFAQMAALPLPDTTARKIYSNPVPLAPGLSVMAYVPTSAERQGNFSSFGAPLIDPKTNAPFGANVIPAAEMVSWAHAGAFAWRIRGIRSAPAGYGYGYGYASGFGVELI
jgi:hypothetical protein